MHNWSTLASYLSDLYFVLHPSDNSRFLLSYYSVWRFYPSCFIKDKFLFLRISLLFLSWRINLLHIKFTVESYCFTERKVILIDKTASAGSQPLSQPTASGQVRVPKLSCFISFKPNFGEFEKIHISGSTVSQIVPYLQWKLSGSAFEN